MYKNIEEEIKIFENHLNSMDEELMASVLADIIIKNTTTTEKDGVKTNNYDKFDELVSKIKNMLDSYKATEQLDFDLKSSIKNTIESLDNVEKECTFSLRSLYWVKSLMEEDKNNKKEENKDA